MHHTRRRFLAATGSMATLTLAGCLGGGSGGGDGDSAGDTVEDHPVAQALDSQPRFGPPPGDASGLIVAFEDPSCPRCAAFERDTVPKIRSELTEPGDATFVFRGYPVVYDWGDPAARALEATYARDEAAHWDLADHYFSNQKEFRSAGRGQVLSKTREYLSSNTDVDGDTVVTAVENGDVDDAIETDLTAGQDGGAGGSTPTIFLFRDGEFLESGLSIGFDTIKATLGL